MNRTVGTPIEDSAHFVGETNDSFLHTIVELCDDPFFQVPLHGSETVQIARLSLSVLQFLHDLRGSVGALLAINDSVEPGS